MIKYLENIDNLTFYNKNDERIEIDSNYIDTLIVRKIKFICEDCGLETITSIYNYNVSLCKKCKSKKTFIKKYGVNHPFKSKEIIKKCEETSLKKYGVKNNFQIKEIREKATKTYNKKFGSNSPFSDSAVREKRRKTLLNRYKNENFNNPEKISKSHLNREKKVVERSIEKTKKTNLKKYGVEFVFQSEEIKNKIKNTNIKKFDVKNFSQTEEFKENLRKKTFFRLYKSLFESDRLQNKVFPLFTLEEYEGKNTNYRFQCVFCDNIFFSNLDDGKIPRCLNCYPKISGTSRLEKEIINWLKSLNVEIIENTKSIISPLELDIYIPSHKLAIEFNGLYWHSELQGKDSFYHLNKTNKCLEKGIQLLHIFEDEWIEKQDIVKSIIRSKLGLYDFVVHGRRCIYKLVDSKQVNKFYFENHIQGKCRSEINLGLFYENNLISCLSFSKPRFNKKYDWEITRFANKLNYKIHGGFSKLWNHKPEGSIITYSDKRLFTGSIYKKYMTQIEDSEPAYWYIKEGQRFNRIKFQKHKLFKLENYDKNLTEWENMQLNDYDRIYDCGNYKFIWRKNESSIV